MVEAERRQRARIKDSEFPQVYPWLSREEWLASLLAPEARNTKDLLGELIKIFPHQLNAGNGALFATGETAIPQGFLNHAPETIDIAMLFSREQSPKDVHELYLIQKALDSVYNSSKYSNLRPFLGELRFGRNIADDSIVYYAQFAQRRGRRINLILPEVSEDPVSVEDYIGTFRQNHKDLGRNLRRLGINKPKPDVEETVRMRLLGSSYIVPLLP